MSMTISRPLLRAQWLKSLSEVTAIGVIGPYLRRPCPGPAGSVTPLSPAAQPGPAGSVSALS
jgi:hypothetical protein